MSKSDVEYMKRACRLCDNSKCGYKTGCVAVKGEEVLAESWNETLPGEIYCQNGVCVRDKEDLHGGKEPGKVCCIHAEAALVGEAAKKGVSLTDSTIYATTFPCIICTRLLVKAGVSKIYYMSDYMGGAGGTSLFDANGIKVEQIKEDDVWT